MPATDPADDAPSRVDPVVATLSEVVGGPLGSRAGHHRWWSPQRVALATTTVVLAAGMSSRAGCAASSWSGDTEPYARLCWTELAGVPAARGDSPWPASGLTRVAEWLAGPLPGGELVATVAVLAIALAVLALVATLLLARTRGLHPWAAAGWAAAPVLAVHWLSWDLVAAVGLALLLWAWAARDRGAPAVLAMGVGGFLLVSFAHPLVTTAAPDTGSLWLVLEQAGWEPRRLVRLAVLAGLVGLAAAAARVVVRREGGTGTVAVARTTLVPAATFLLLAPSAPPEAALLLLPLAAAADLAWRDLLVWQGCEVVSWAITGWYLAGLLAPSDGGDARAYWVAVVIRAAGLVWLTVAALRSRST